MCRERSLITRASAFVGVKAADGIRKAKVGNATVIGIKGSFDTGPIGKPLIVPVVIGKRHKAGYSIIGKRHAGDCQPRRCGRVSLEMCQREGHSHRRRTATAISDCDAVVPTVTSRVRVCVLSGPHVVEPIAGRVQHIQPQDPLRGSECREERIIHHAKSIGSPEVKRNIVGSPCDLCQLDQTEVVARRRH